MAITESPHINKYQKILMFTLLVIKLSFKLGLFIVNTKDWKVNYPQTNDI